jgi:protein-S-isoprenylcysteine O-methyltransferase Ste14
MVDASGTASEGINKPRRMYPPLYLGIAILVMLGLHSLAPMRQLIDWPHRYWGLLPMVVGICLGISVNAMFRRVGTTIKPFEESSNLVVGGPFRFSRNPVYLGMAFLLVGLGVLLGSLTPLLVIPAFVLIIDRRFIRAEETMLARTFGAQYDVYRARVRRWF